MIDLRSDTVTQPTEGMRKASLSSLAKKTPACNAITIKTPSKINGTSQSLNNSKAKNLSNKYKQRFKFINSKFSEIDKIPEAKNANAIIFDLGFSMIQMKDLKRGFSFNSKGSLNMKMGLNNFNANDAINRLDKKEIEKNNALHALISEIFIFNLKI